MAENSRVWIWPIAIALCYVLTLAFFGSHWTWSLYDELSWIEYYARIPNPFSFIKSDFFSDGRIRPLSQIINYSRFDLLGIHPQALRIEKVLELVSTVGVTGYYLIRIKRIPWFASALGLSFWLKSPPLLEQLRWLTVIELPGIFFLVVALILRPRSVFVSYFVVLLAALTKEPMALLIPLPALLERRWKEFSLATGVFIFYIGFLFFNRHGYSSFSTLNTYALFEIAKQGAIDLAPLLLLLLMATRLRRAPLNHEFWQAIVFATFGIAYGVLVIRMAWGYTYIFAPSIFLIAIGLAFALSAAAKMKNLSKWAYGFCFLLVVLFSFRVGWNWTKNYRSMTERHKLFQAVADNTGDGIVGTNCPRDRRSIGFAADLLKNKNPLEARKDGPYCGTDSATTKDCCDHAQFVALGAECFYFSERVAQAHQQGLKQIYSTTAWALFKCPGLNLKE